MSKGGAQAAIKPPLFNWHAYLNVHPAAELFPLMPEAELKDLAADIAVNGLIDPIVLWKDDRLLLDGRNRLDALALAGRLGVNDRGKLCDVETRKSIKVQFFTDGDPYKIALSLNVHRRHLTSEQKRELLAKLLKAEPEKSNVQIAKMAHADDKTAASVREKLEATSEIPRLKVRVDKRGSKRPVKTQRQRYRGIDKFRQDIVVVCGAAARGGYDVPFPPNLTPEIVASALEDVTEAIETLRKLKARLKAHAIPIIKGDAA
jgi:hypothetical protein